MDYFIAPDPTSAGDWVLDDIFHFMGGTEDDAQALGALREANASANARAAADS